MSEVALYDHFVWQLFWTNSRGTLRAARGLFGLGTSLFANYSV